MKIEIHAKRGETATSIDFPTPETLRLTLQMGTTADMLAEILREVVNAEVLTRIISLWANPDHPREFTEDGRHLFIRDFF